MTAPGPAARFDELRRNWPFLVPCLFGIMLSSFQGYSLGVMTIPIEREFGWTRSEIAGGYFIDSILVLMAAPLVGMAADRFGARRIALCGILLYCLCLSALSLTSRDVHIWWSLWSVLALGQVFVMPHIWIKAISAGFSANRGIAIAIALCGTGLCSMLVPSLANALVVQWGWRAAYVGLAIIGGCVTFPLAWLLFHPFARTATAAATPGDGAPSVQPGISVREGYGSPLFRKLACAVGLYALAISILTTNLVPVLVSGGHSPARAAALAGLMGVGTIVGRLCSGLLLDRLFAPRIGAAAVLLTVISVALLLGLPSSPVATGLACLTIGLSAGGEYDSAAYIAARHFGSRNLGALFGAITGVMTFGAAIGPIISNLVYDLSGSYTFIIWLEIPASIATALLFLSMGNERPLFSAQMPDTLPSPEAPQ